MTKHGTANKIIAVIKSNPNHDEKGRFTFSSDRWTKKESFWSLKGGKGRQILPRDPSKIESTLASFGKEFDSPTPHERFVLTSDGVPMPESVAWKEAEVSGNDEVGWTVNLYGEKKPNQYFKAPKLKGVQKTFSTKAEAQSYGESWIQGRGRR